MHLCNIHGLNIFLGNSVCTLIELTFVPLIGLDRVQNYVCNRYEIILIGTFNLLHKKKRNIFKSTLKNKTKKDK